jgi:hypothetical protein
MATGWIKVYRSIWDKGWSKKPEFVAVWLYLLKEATHEKREVFWNGSTVFIDEGQFITGRLKIAENTGVHESSVERILKTFEIEQQIEQRKTSTSRLISICNWHKYQESEQRFEQPLNNERTTAEQPLNTKQEYKELKNVRIKEVFVIPQKIEIENYLFEKHTEIAPDRVAEIGAAFFDHYSSNGWKVGGKTKMVDWKAAVRNWIRNEKKFAQNGKTTTGTEPKERKVGRVPESGIRNILEGEIPIIFKRSGGNGGNDV